MRCICGLGLHWAVKTIDEFFRCPECKRIWKIELVEGKEGEVAKHQDKSSL
jgi:hypothetical protein